MGVFLLRSVERDESGQLVNRFTRIVGDLEDLKHDYDATVKNAGTPQEVTVLYRKPHDFPPTPHYSELGYASPMEAQIGERAKRVERDTIDARVTTLRASPAWGGPVEDGS